MKILFINPMYTRDWAKALPLSIAYLSAALKKSGFTDIEAIDANALEKQPAQVIKDIRDIKPDIVAVTATTLQIIGAWQICEGAKKINPNIITLLGGPHPTSLPEESLDKGYVDFIVKGEGEETIVEFIKSLDKRDFGSIRGLSFKQGGHIYHNPGRPPIENLDSLPLPNREILPFPKRYRSLYQTRKRYTTIITSRGCPGRCIFCNKNIFGSNFRARSPENVVAEMQELKERYGIEEFHIVDDVFSWNIARVDKICDLLIESKLGLTWACTNGLRVDAVKKELLIKMKAAGCYRISFGIESGSDKILKIIGKNIDLEMVRKTFADAQEAGLITVALFMLGNWSENETTMQQTIEFAKSLKTDYAQFNVATPFPGTVFYELVRKHGRFLTTDWWEYNFFEGRPVFETKDLTASLIRKMYSQAQREFYFRPSQICFLMHKRLKYKNKNDLKPLVSSFCRLLRRIIYP